MYIHRYICIYIYMYIYIHTSLYIYIYTYQVTRLAAVETDKELDVGFVAAVAAVSALLLLLLLFQSAPGVLTRTCRFNPHLPI